jgi:hypothetical protein
MAPDFTDIEFKQGIPAFSLIRERFFALTGVDITIRAGFNVPVLCKPSEVTELIINDQHKVSELFRERSNFYAAHPQQYELMAQKRDEINDRLRPYAYVKDLCFEITGFYELEFWVKGTTLTVMSNSGQYYGVEALFCTLDDLGGTFPEDINIEKQRRFWRRLKRWEDYDPITRPSK